MSVGRATRVPDAPVVGPARLPLGFRRAAGGRHAVRQAPGSRGARRIVRLAGLPRVDAVVLGVAYLALQQASFALLDPFGRDALWPPAGLAMAALLLTRSERWSRLLAAVAVASVAGGLLQDENLTALLTLAACGVVEPLFGATVLRRVWPRAASLARPVDVFAFLGVGVLAAPAATGLLAAAAMGADAGTLGDYWSNARGWFASDAMGILVVGPLVLSWARWRPSTRRWAVESLLALAAVALLTVLLFSGEPGEGLALVGLPMLSGLLVWPSLHLGKQIVSLAVAVVAVVIVLETQRGSGAFTLESWSLEERLTAIQLFVGGLALVNLVVAATALQRRRAVERAHRVAAALATERALLKRSNERLAEFSYVVSHDLSAPLRTLTGFSELLERRYADLLDERGRGYVANIGTGAVRMQRLLDALLEYSRAGVDAASIAEPVDLRSTAEAVWSGLLDDPEVGDPGARLELPARTPSVRLAPTQADRILINLLSNSLKYRRPDVPLVVSLSVLGVENGYCRLQVADNGRGIAPEHRERALQVFQRVHPGSGASGEGIGLATVKRIVEDHGGDVEITEAPGGGCAVRLRVPVA